MRKFFCVLFAFLILTGCAETTVSPEDRKEETVLEISEEEAYASAMEKRRDEIISADRVIVHLTYPLLETSVLRFFQSLPQERTVVFSCDDKDYSFDLMKLEGGVNTDHAYPLEEIEKTGTISREHFAYYNMFRVKEDKGNKTVLLPASVGVSPKAIFAASLEPEKTGKLSPGDHLSLYYLWKTDYLRPGEYDLKVYDAVKVDYSTDYYEHMSEDEIAYENEILRLSCAEGPFIFTIPDSQTVMGMTPFSFNYLDTDKITYRWRDQRITYERKDIDPSWYQQIHMHLYIPWIFEGRDLKDCDVEVHTAEITDIRESSWKAKETAEKTFPDEELICDLPLPEGAKTGDYVKVVYTYDRENRTYSFLEASAADGPEEIGAP